MLDQPRMRALLRARESGGGRPQRVVEVEGNGAYSWHWDRFDWRRMEPLDANCTLAREMDSVLYRLDRFAVARMVKILRPREKSTVYVRKLRYEPLQRTTKRNPGSE